MKKNTTFFILVIYIVFMAGCLTTRPAQEIAGNNIRVMIVPFVSETGTNQRDVTKNRDECLSLTGRLESCFTEKNMVMVMPAENVVRNEFNVFFKKHDNSRSKACAAICQKYNTEYAFLIWLDIVKDRNMQGQCDAKVKLRLEGYDKKGNDTKIYFNKSFDIYRTTFEKASREAQREAGNYIGTELPYAIEKRRQIFQLK